MLLIQNTKSELWVGEVCRVAAVQVDERPIVTVIATRDHSCGTHGALVLREGCWRRGSRKSPGMESSLRSGMVGRRAFVDAQQ